MFFSQVGLYGGKNITFKIILNVQKKKVSGKEYQHIALIEGLETSVKINILQNVFIWLESTNKRIYSFKLSS